ncbi:MAG: hypothetical protein IJ661_10195 [Lachnospiraceae bacterium]|nr:hypothetical protein [Lachnospiraceae bacterium]
MLRILYRFHKQVLYGVYLRTKLVTLAKVSGMMPPVLPMTLNERSEF